MASNSMDLVDIAELRTEAAAARRLAVEFKDTEAVADLLNYAAALEGDANRCEQMFCRPENALTVGTSRGSLWTNLFRVSPQH